MRGFESYTVVVEHANGDTDSTQYDDVVQASEAYAVAASRCERGESVELHRSTFAVLGTKVRA